MFQLPTVQRRARSVSSLNSTPLGALLIGRRRPQRMGDAVLLPGPNIIVHGAAHLSPAPGRHTHTHTHTHFTSRSALLRLASGELQTCSCACDFSSESTNNSAIQMAILTDCLAGRLSELETGECRPVCRPHTAHRRHTALMTAAKLSSSSTPRRPYSSSCFHHASPISGTAAVCSRACHHHLELLSASALRHVRSPLFVPTSLPQALPTKDCDVDIDLTFTSTLPRLPQGHARCRPLLPPSPKRAHPLTKRD